MTSPSGPLAMLPAPSERAMVRYTMYMKVLGIDPGYGRCGVAILERAFGKDILHYSECIETSPHMDFTERLSIVAFCCVVFFVVFVLVCFVLVFFFFVLC